MPELPEVETIVRGLRPMIVGETIVAVDVRWPRVVADGDVQRFQQGLLGKTITAVQRRGKHILVHVPSMWLAIHLRMTGQLLVGDDLDGDPHVHLVLQFASGRKLTYRDVRKFGRFSLVDQPDEIVGRLGAEPLAPEFDVAALQALLAGRHRQIKPALLDQHVLAGLGNIYVDEALWLAGIHPLRRTHTLSGEQVRRLHDALRQVLTCALENGGTTLRDFRDPDNESGHNQACLAVYHRHGQSCLRCGATIERMTVGQRGTHYCPVCQVVPPADEKEQ